jgi:hypothetical protein
VDDVLVEPNFVSEIGSGSGSDSGCSQALADIAEASSDYVYLAGRLRSGSHSSIDTGDADR